MATASSASCKPGRPRKTELHLDDLSPEDAPSLFSVANRHTFKLSFQRGLDTPSAQIARREGITETIVRFVRK